MSEEDLESMLFNEVPLKIILNLEKTGEGYASNLSTELDVTYSHVIKVLNRFNEYGVTETRKTGRRKYHEITDYGLELAEAIREVDAVLGGEEDEQSKNSLRELDLSA